MNGERQQYGLRMGDGGNLKMIYNNNSISIRFDSIYFRFVEFTYEWVNHETKSHYMAAINRYSIFNLIAVKGFTIQKQPP